MAVTIEDIIEMAEESNLPKLRGVINKCRLNRSRFITIDVPHIPRGEHSIEAKIITVNVVEEGVEHVDGSWDVEYFVFVRLRPHITLSHADKGRTLVNYRNVKRTLDLIHMAML